MLGGFILAVWLFLSINRDKSAFFEGSMFTIIVIVAAGLMQWSIPDVDNMWLLSWAVVWIYAIFVFWFLDVIALNFFIATLLSAGAGVGYFYLTDKGYAQMAAAKVLGASLGM